MQTMPKSTFRHSNLNSETAPVVIEEQPLQSEVAPYLVRHPAFERLTCQAYPRRFY